MSERAYTVAEIDALRARYEMRYLYGSYAPDFSTVRFSRSYHEYEKIAAVEQMVRTSMLVGHTADDLLASERTPTGGRDDE